MKTGSGQTQTKQKASSPASETAKKKNVSSETLEFEDLRESSREQADLQTSIEQSPCMIAQQKQIARVFGPAIQGKDIYLAPGQEKNLPHESWHVVQQKQGRVVSMDTTLGEALNNDPLLEAEADRMGSKAIAQKDFQSSTDLQLPGSPAASPRMRPMQQKPVIQRLTGFEVELNIPFYGSADGGAYDKKMFKPKQSLNDTERRDIADFLWGGLIYGKQYADKPGAFDISADHGKYKSAHIKFMKTMTSKGYVTKPSGKFKSMTNMEYRTKALEERDDDSQDKIDQMAKDIQAHADTSVSRSTLDEAVDLPAPITSLYTAVPMSAFGKLVKGDGEAESALSQVKDAIDPTVYYQTTTGTLPSEIPELFTEAAADIGKKKRGKTSRANVSKTMLELAVKMAEDVCGSGTHGPLFAKFTSGEVNSLKGWMTLVAQYLLAYQVEVTSYAFREDSKIENKLVRYGGTGKNMVAYLSKTPLVETISALPPKVRPNVKDGEDKEKWIALFKGLLSESNKGSFNIITQLGLTDYAGQNYYNSRGKNPKKIKHQEIFGDQDPQTWLSSTLQGVPVFHVMTGNKLTLDDEQDKPSPGLTVKGEEAIPLEDRKSQSKKSFGLGKDVDKIEHIIKKEWKAAIDRRLASTKDRAEFDGLREKADAFVKKFGDATEKLKILKTLKTNFEKITLDPLDVEKEKKKLDDLVQEFISKLDETFEQVKEYRNQYIAGLKANVTVEDDLSAIAELENESTKISDAYGDSLYEKLNGLKAYIVLDEQILKQIDDSFESMKRAVVQKVKQVSQEKLTPKVKEECEKEYQRINTAGSSLQGIKDFKALFEKISAL